VSASVDAIEYRVNVNTQEQHAAQELGLNDIGSVRLILGESIAYDNYDNNREMGGFILIDKITNNTVAAVMITGSSEHETKGVNAAASPFEIEFNALVRRHFPHWNAAIIT
jgi:sulfate adenylyltransferase subunit 1